MVADYDYPGEAAFKVLDHLLHAVSTMLRTAPSAHFPEIGRSFRIFQDPRATDTLDTAEHPIPPSVKFVGACDISQLHLFSYDTIDTCAFDLSGEWFIPGAVSLCESAGIMQMLRFAEGMKEGERRHRAGTVSGTFAYRPAGCDTVGNYSHH